MKLIDAYIILGSDRKLLLTLLILFITGFGLCFSALAITQENVRWRLIAGRSLPFNWKGVAVFLSLLGLCVLVVATLILKNALSTREQPAEDPWEVLDSIEFPELRQESRLPGPRPWLLLSDLSVREERLVGGEGAHLGGRRTRGIKAGLG